MYRPIVIISNVAMELVGNELPLKIQGTDPLISLGV